MSRALIVSIASLLGSAVALAGHPLDLADAHPAAESSRSCAVDYLGRSLPSGIRLTSAVAGTDGVCAVSGSVATSGGGAPTGSAQFLLELPTRWNGRLLFLGGAGFDGNVPETPSSLLARGYATLATDSGHAGDRRYFPGTDATWAVASPGVRDEAKFADYAFRARHQVNEAVRPLVPLYYSGRAIARSYFVGCSNGGREALLEAQNHPGDYDGFVAGNPYVGVEDTLLHARNARVLLAAPLPSDRFAAINAAVMAECDAKDGVKDGLIQNPAMCAFDPKGLVANGTLTARQGKALSAYLTQPVDTRGRAIGFANAVSGMGDLFPSPPQLAGGLTGISTYLAKDTPPSTSGFPWGPMPGGPIDWQLGTGAIGSLVYRERGFSLLDRRVTRTDGTLEAGAVDRARAEMNAMMPDPARMGAFFASGAKLIIYHGFDDAILNPFAVMATYRRIARTGGGIDRARASARLFMVPNMSHCGLGTGPNTLDPLSAMEAWVERGVAPDAMIALHFPTAPGQGAPDRSMPVCPYPQTARYDRRGPVDVAGSWTCGTGPGDLTHSGRAGALAGWRGGA